MNTFPFPFQIEAVESLGFSKGGDHFIFYKEVDDIFIRIFFSDEEETQLRIFFDKSFKQKGASNYCDINETIYYYCLFFEHNFKDDELLKIRYGSLLKVIVENWKGIREYGVVLSKYVNPPDETIFLLYEFEKSRVKYLSSLTGLNI